MEVTLNWLAIGVATIVSMLFAKVWFQDWSFGPRWRELTGVTPADSKKNGKTPILATLVANIVTVIAFAYLLALLDAQITTVTVGVALAVAVIAWAAFSASTLLTHNLFEGKPFQLTVINSGYQLMMFAAVCVTLSVMGV